MARRLQLVKQLEGIVPGRVKSGLSYRCDQCLTDIEAGDSLSLYFSDEDYRGENQFARFNRAYCTECDRTEIHFPKEGANEGVVVAEFDEDMAFRNVHLVDKSAAGEGVPWDPVQIWNDYMGVPLEDYMQDTHNGDITSQHIADILLSLDVDVRHIVDDDGDEIIGDEQKKELMRQIEEKRPQKVQELAEKL